MEIPREVIEAHGRLSHCSLGFLEFVRNNPDSLERLNYNLSELEDDIITLQPWPTFVNQKTVEKLREASTKICRLIKSLPQRIFANRIDDISQFFEIPQDVVEYQLAGITESHLNSLLARGDYILSSSGFKCLEFNVTAKLGGWQSSYMQPYFLNIPVISRFLQEYGVKVTTGNLLKVLFNHIIGTTLQACDYTLGEINTMIAVSRNTPWYHQAFQEKYLQDCYGEILRRRYGSLGGEIEFGNVDDLHLCGKDLFLKNTRIHALVELNHGRITPPAYAAFIAGRIRLFNGPITGLLSNKLNLALLSEYEDSDLFNHQERQDIKKYIPWTRKMTPRLEDFVLSSREKLVLKPAAGIGGVDVFVGKHTPASRWREVVQAALRAGGWVVQECIDSLLFLYQADCNGCAHHRIVWGLFVFGSQYAGGWIRLQPETDITGVINSTQGAEESMILEVEEDTDGYPPGY